MTEYAGSYAKAAQYAEGEVTKNGTTYTIRVYLEQAPYQFAIRYQLFEVVNGTVNPTPVKTVTVSDNNNYGPSAPSLETVLGKTDRTYLDEGDSLVYARYDVYDPDLTDGQVSQSGTVGGTGAEQLTYTVNYYCASFTGGYLTISKTISGVPATDTAAWAELRELTFTVQKLVVTESADSAPSSGWTWMVSPTSPSQSSPVLNPKTARIPTPARPCSPPAPTGWWRTAAI